MANHLQISIAYTTAHPVQAVEFTSPIKGLKFHACNVTMMCSDPFEPKAYVIPIQIHYSTNATMQPGESNGMALESATYDIDPNYGLITFPINREFVLGTMILGLSLLAKYLWDEGGKQRMHNMRIRVDPRYLEEEMHRKY